MRVLIVDDQRSARRILADLLGGLGLEGLSVLEAGSLREARQVLDQEPIDVALIDVRLDADARNRDGLALVREVRERTTAVPIVVTSSSEMAEIRTAMSNGAYDYVLKDELCEELVAPVLRGLASRRALEREVTELRARRSAGDFPSGLVGASAAMERLRATIRRVALSDRPVLVVGQTGSGKELVVRSIHALGAHPDEPLLDLNCGAIPEPLIEAQLFGHERGAFTGADRRQEGYLAAVGRGTLFLDEIAELPLPLQAKLLRVLETGGFRLVGSTVERRFAGRVIAATHADLEVRVRDGRFREDLFYRLHVLPVTVPPLDERRDDVPALLAHFARGQHRALRFSPEAIEQLSSARWPGNVRQLRNLVDRLAVFSDDDEVTPATLGAFAGAADPADEGTLRTVARAVLRHPCANKLEAVEEALIQEAMALSDGNKSGAARLLGVHRKVIERRLDAAHRAGGDDTSG